MRNETKPSNWNFVKRRARQFVLLLIIGVVKHRTALKETASYQAFEIYVRGNSDGYLFIHRQHD